MGNDDTAPLGAADTEPTPTPEPPKRGRGRPRKEPATPKAAAGHVIAPGKAITTIRGILAEGAAISAADLSGGADAFEALIKGGYVVPG